MGHVIMGIAHKRIPFLVQRKQVLSPVWYEGAFGYIKNTFDHLNKNGVERKWYSI